MKTLKRLRVQACLWLPIMTLSLMGCGAPVGAAYQNSTIDALLDGNYDGELTIAELKRHGDFGIGTFNRLDGELIAFDGWFYQIRSDGRAYLASQSMRTPFAVVTSFKPSETTTLSGPMTFEQLQTRLDAFRPVDGHVYAFEIEGWFDKIRTRSVAPQRRPYPRLIDAVKEQKSFEEKDLRGRLVGFWFPESMRHVNVPGYHFHFISEGRSIGGHVQDLTLRRAKVRVQQISTVEIALPSTLPTTQPGQVISDELDRVEKGAS